MALNKVCDNGHKYISPDIIAKDWIPGRPICPECRREWDKAHELTEQDTIPVIQRVCLEPGDVLVFSYEHRIPSAEKARIIDLIKEVFPNNLAVVLDAGMKLSVVGQGDEKEGVDGNSAIL